MGKSKAEIVEAERILACLPDNPDKIREEIIYTDEMIDSIGANVLLIERYPQLIHRKALKQEMSHNDWVEYEKSETSVWAAQMTCTFCGDSFEGWWEHRKGKTPAFVMPIQNERFGYLNFGIDGWTKRDDDLIISTDNAEATCPCCGRYARTHKKSWLGKKGKTFRQLFTSVERFGEAQEYAGVFYWMAELHLDRDGTAMMELLPRDALAVGRDGRLYAFTAEKLGTWERRPLGDKPLGHRPFRSALASHGEQRKATWNCWVGTDDVEGSTMEKTGIDVWLREEDLVNEDPNAIEKYLRFWAKHPNVENLMRSGWAGLVNETVDGKTVPVDWEKVKPHEMLGLTKEEFRSLPYEYRSCKNLTQIKMFKLLYPEQASAGEYVRLLEKYKTALHLLIDRAEPNRFWNPAQVDRYLRKQGLDNQDGLELLADYRYAAESLSALHTDRDWWPKELHNKHDEAAAAAGIKDQPANIYFRMLNDWLQGTAWSDGRLCVRPARSAEELKQEGDVLKHCVGTYAKKMINRTDVIFFVRKARRPERSYLTLDIRMSGDRPTMVQIHGWGNEYRYDKETEKSVSWKIPARDLAFVDRWMEKVMIPWWDQKHGKVETKRRKSA